MKLWHGQNQISQLAKVGGKGLHLQKLVSWGAPVPDFFVLTTDCFRYWRERREIPPELNAKFSAFFEVHPTIALRSSMIGEDQLDASFAGLFETVLGVNKDNWQDSLLKIYQSVTSERVTEYLKKKKIQAELLMAVVAQAQVDVEKSGVLFTRSPVPPTSALAIDAAFGMGEGVVSGLTAVDHYKLTRSGELLEELRQGDDPVLSEEERYELVELCLGLEAKAGVPSDLEWGWKEGKFHVFQIRPITRSFKPLTFLVDTNLSESYPGTVSPFTALFVQNAYAQVFQETALALGAQGKRLEQLDFHYQRLICCVDDHLYYDLEHYYAVLRALPGGEKNIQNWHQMIGGQHGHGVPFHDTKPDALETLSALSSLLRLGLKRKKTFKNLLRELEQNQASIREDLEKLTSSRASIQYLARLVNRPLGFGLTALNDVFIMIGLGLVTGSLKKRGMDEAHLIDLLRTGTGVDSLKPLEAFNQMVKEISPTFISAFEQKEISPGFDPYKKIFEQLEGQGFREEVGKVKNFLQHFGDRSFEELKLESLPLNNDPALLLRLMKWSRSTPIVSQRPSSEGSSLSLAPLQKRFLNFTRECIEVREATRLWRGRFYHLIRSLVLKLGQQLQMEDQRWREFSVHDFFSLNHREWAQYEDGKLSFEEVKNLILARRPWQTKRQHYPELIQWDPAEALPKKKYRLPSEGLSGQGVSPGSAEGLALVLEAPGEALDSELKDFILVTKNTDPAWVYIMSRSRGLISEKGSLLSHTAIIGRELNVPTVVGVRSATQRIQTGTRLRIDGSTGKIEIL